MNINTDTTIERLTDREIELFYKIWEKCYPGLVPDDITEEKKKQVVDRWKHINNEVKTVNFYGYFHKGKLLGGMILYDFLINIFSIKTEIGGIANICVDLLHKKEHIAKELMNFSHNHYYKRGTCLTTLYPFRPDFYAKMGYGIGKKMNQYCFKPKSVPKTTKDNIIYIENADITLLTDCFNRYSAKTHGMIFRDERNFQQILKSSKIVGYKKDDKIEGYISFRFKKINLDNFILNDMIVDEFISNNRKAHFELLTFLHIQDDQINRIIFNSQDDHFHHILADPRNGNSTLFLTAQESNLQGVGIMYRVINSERLFMTLKNHNFRDQTIKLKLTIQDNFAPKNEGSLFITFFKGKPSIVKDNEEYEAEIKLNVANFSSMFMGIISFRKLYDYGLADISKLEYLETVNRLFLTESPPITIEQF